MKRTAHSAAVIAASFSIWSGVTFSDGGGSSSARRIRTSVAKYPNLVVAYQSKPLLSLFTILRDKSTGHRDFTHAADRILRLLAEEGLAESRVLTHKIVKTPCGEYEGLTSKDDGETICVVSIVRAGDTLQEAVRNVAPGVLLGKILIQRDETTAEKAPRLYFVKLPPRESYKKVILVDPMLATGNSAIMAIRELIRAGVKEEDIVFLNVVACPEGLERIFTSFPKIRVVTGSIDSHLDSNLYIVPGLGDFGDSA